MKLHMLKRNISTTSLNKPMFYPIKKLYIYKRKLCIRIYTTFVKKKPTHIIK